MSAGALQARRIDAAGLVGLARVELEIEGSTLVVKRIVVSREGVVF